MQVLRAFVQALYVSRMSRKKFERWQARHLNRWLTEDLRRVAFYKEYQAKLSALPVIDKASVMARFEDFNLGRITTAQAWRAHERSGEIGAVSIGASTGTSGNRGLYAITPAERHRWLGVMLAKTVPVFMFRPERVAVILPQSSSLYETANKTGRLRLAFFDLREGAEVWGDALTKLDPTTIVAPPRILRHLAETQSKLKPRKIFAGAETLDPVDRTVIEKYFGLTLGQIYMATEGLFGVSCARGKLHLAEDATHFEFETVGDGLVSPLVTGYRRSFQIMARYRMNDLLRLSHDPCSCGSPLRVIEEVVGRMDDAFAFGDVLITPDILRNAILDAARDITDFRLLRATENEVILVLTHEQTASSADAAKQALVSLFSKRGAAARVVVRRAALHLEADQKLRRIRNCWENSL